MTRDEHTVHWVEIVVECPGCEEAPSIVPIIDRIVDLGGQILGLGVVRERCSLTLKVKLGCCAVDVDDGNRRDFSISYLLII